MKAAIFLQEDLSTLNHVLFEYSRSTSSPEVAELVEELRLKIGYAWGRDAQYVLALMPKLRGEES